MVLVLVVIAVVVIFVVQLLTWPALARRGQAARAANGGRHTRTWWIGLGVVLVGVALLAVLELT